MASVRPSSASSACTPLFCAAALPPVLTWEPNSAPWAGAAGPEGAAPGTAVGLPPTPQVVVVVLASVVVVVSVGSVVGAAAVVAVVSLTGDRPAAAVSVVDDEAATSAPAGAGGEATTTVTAPAIDSPAKSAAATARRGDSLRAAGRVGTIGDLRGNGGQRPAQRPATTLRDIFALIREVPARRSGLDPLPPPLPYRVPSSGGPRPASTARAVAWASA